ncbi:MAG: hypothetical protein ABR915_25000, partial [Thermoguttaceae bacterium]
MPNPDLPSAQRPLPVRWLLQCLSIAGSLYLAIALMGILVFVLALGTCLENWYGEAAAKFGIYGAWWFTLLGALLGLNILSALLVRLPWRWRQIGFVAAHVGLLLLLLGCLQSRWSGIEANLGVFEHRESGRACRDSMHFELSFPEAASQSDGESAPITIPFHPGPFDWQQYGQLWAFPWRLVGHDQGLTYDQDGIRLAVLDYYADYKLAAIPRLELRVAGPRGSPHGGRSMSHPQVPVVLSVRAAAGPHGMPAGPHGLGNAWGEGTRHGLPDGQQVNFWMTGSEEETAAFRHARPDGPLGKLG